MRIGFAPLLRVTFTLGSSLRRDTATSTGDACATHPRVASASVPAEPIVSLKGAHQMNSIKSMAIEKPQRRRFRKKSTLKPACPGCRMIKNDWPGEGYTHDGET